MNKNQLVSWAKFSYYSLENFRVMERFDGGYGFQTNTYNSHKISVIKPLNKNLTGAFFLQFRMKKFQGGYGFQTNTYNLNRNLLWP